MHLNSFLGGGVLSLLAFCILSAPPSPAQSMPNTASAGGGDHASVPGSISVGGVTRTYLLYIPHRFEPRRSALIVALHGRGAGGPGSAMEQYSRLDAKADREGFAIAYLDGLVDATGSLNWNYFYDPFFINGPDDVGFVRALIDFLQGALHPNRRRIYVTGTSAGGFMAQRIAVELSDRVAAIGAVEGNLFVNFPNSPPVPAPKAPISVLMLKGDGDPNNQYCGAVFPSFGLVEASADQDFDYWTGSSANACQDVHPDGPLCLSVGVGDAQAVVTPGIASSLVHKTGTACRRNTEVQLYRLLGGLDNWNLDRMDVPDKLPYNPDLNARTGVSTNDILWKFFDEHPLGGEEKGGEERSREQ